MDPDECCCYYDLLDMAEIISDMAAILVEQRESHYDVEIFREQRCACGARTPCAEQRCACGARTPCAQAQRIDDALERRKALIAEGVDDA